MVQMLDRLFWHHWISFIWWAEGAKILPFFVRHAFGITIQNGGIVTDGEELEARKTRQTNGVFFFFCLHRINCYLSPFYSSVCSVRFLVGWLAGMLFSNSLKETMISENDGRSFGSLHRTKLQQN
jgi:hypothetical protein